MPSSGRNAYRNGGAVIRLPGAFVITVTGRGTIGPQWRGSHKTARRSGMRVEGSPGPR